MTDTLSTLATTAYDRLRAEIIAGTIVPGSKILTRPVCERLQIGLSPMREALNRLSAEGLVTQSDRRGFSAAPLDLADLADLTLARSALNEAALRDSIVHGDVAWEEAVLLAHHRLIRASRNQHGPSPEWEHRHRVFHSSLLEACRSLRLRQDRAQLFDAAERYRLASRLTGRSSRNVAREHQAIADAVVGRDAETAARLLNAHVQRTAELVHQTLVAAKK